MLTGDSYLVTTRGIKGNVQILCTTWGSRLNDGHADNRMPSRGCVRQGCGDAEEEGERKGFGVSVILVDFVNMKRLKANRRHLGYSSEIREPA